MARILLLEPDVDLGRVYADALQNSGHKVLLSKEAGQAIVLLDSQPVELIIVEIQIALHNGVEFLYEMRSYPDWQHIPVIIHSVVPKIIIEQNKLLTQQLNISEILYKPTTKLDTLLTVVHRNIKNQAVL